MTALVTLILILIGLSKFVIIAAVIYSWLVNFNVINSHNQFVAVVGQVLYRLTEPVLSQVRRIIPPIGGLDLSPVVVFILLIFLEVLVKDDLAPALGVY